MTGKSILLYSRAAGRKRIRDRIFSYILILQKILLLPAPERQLSSGADNIFIEKGRLSGSGNSVRSASADENSFSSGRRISAAEPDEASAGFGTGPSGILPETGSVSGGTTSSRTDLNRNADILMRKYADNILSFAYTYMQNRPDAEEILQDTMIAYLVNAPVFANYAHARAWLLSTARNLCLNRLRYNRYRRHADLDETLSERLAAPSKEDRSFLLDAVKELPEAMRESIYLFYWEGYSTYQIAVLLGRRENTVRSDLSRARKRLKAILKEEYDFG